MKRFYKDARLSEAEQGFMVTLDQKPLRTPASRILLLPTRQLGEVICAEWAEAGDQIKGGDMPIFSAAVTIIDRAIPHRTALSDELVRYAGNDVLCYRAGEGDPALNLKQQTSWDSWLSGAKDRLGLSFIVVCGLMPTSQPEANAKLISAYLAGISDWHFGCLYRAVTLSGSFVLGQAFIDKQLGANGVFELACLEELHQNEKWGCDDESQFRQNNIRAELTDVESFMSML